MLWDMHTRESISEPLRGNSSHLAFSPDGKTLATAGGHGPVILWSMDVNSWQKRAGEMANRNFTCQEWTQYMGQETYRATFPHLPTEYCEKSHKTRDKTP